MVTHMTSGCSSPSDMCIQPENSQSCPSPFSAPLIVTTPPNNRSSSSPKPNGPQLRRQHLCWHARCTPLITCFACLLTHHLLLHAHSQAHLFTYIHAHILVAFSPHLIHTLTHPTIAQPSSH